jgi:hypothetical protein
MIPKDYITDSLVRTLNASYNNIYGCNLNFHESEMPNNTS